MGNDVDDWELTICIAFAAATGLVYTLAVNTVAVAKQRAKGELDRRQETCLTVAYSVVITLGVVPLYVATAHGPVSIVMPVVYAANLLSNLILQSALRVTRFNKSAVVGTWVLSLAAIQLVDVGPKDLPTTSNTLQRMSEPLAIAWMVGLIVAVLCGCIAVPFLRDLPRDDFMKLIAFTVVVSIPAALNNTIIKLCSRLPAVGQIICSVAYFVLGYGSTLASALGHAALDNSLSVPAFSCGQILTNGLTGCFVWGDFERIDDPIAYVIVYVLFALGMYLCCPADAFAARGVQREQTGLTANLIPAPITESVREFFRAKKEFEQQRVRNIAPKVRALLESAADVDGALHVKPELLELCCTFAGIVEDKSDELPDVVETWMGDHWRYINETIHDPVNSIDGGFDRAEEQHLTRLQKIVREATFALPEAKPGQACIIV